jgi:serine/threonine protein kinase
MIALVQVMRDIYVQLSPRLSFLSQLNPPNEDPGSKEEEEEKSDKDSGGRTNRYPPPCKQLFPPTEGKGGGGGGGRGGRKKSNQEGCEFLLDEHYQSQYTPKELWRCGCPWYIEYRRRRCDGVEVAIKIKRLEEHPDRNLEAQTEIQMARLATHSKARHVAPLLDVYKWPNVEGEYALVFPRLKPIDVAKLGLDHGPGGGVRVLAQQLLESLHDLHQLSVAHLDVKPDNVMLDPHTGELQLIDFGHARIIHPCSKIDRRLEGVGTYGFRAPELDFDYEYYYKYAESDDGTQGVVEGLDIFRADIYSAGITILFWLLPIFRGKDKKKSENYWYYEEEVDSFIGYLLTSAKKFASIAGSSKLSSRESQEIGQLCQLALKMVASNPQNRSANISSLLEDPVFQPPLSDSISKLKKPLSTTTTTTSIPHQPQKYPPQNSLKAKVGGKEQNKINKENLPHCANQSNIVVGSPYHFGSMNTAQ